MSSEDAAATWDREAHTFDESADHGLRDSLVRAAWRELLTSVLPPAPARIADVGCGTGSLSVLLAEEGHLVHGIDLSPRMIERARAKADRHGVDPRPRFDLGDAGTPSPPLIRSAFDVVLCRHVLWALLDPAAALARWIELIDGQGRLVLIEGRWDTGAGLDATRVLDLVSPMAKTCTVLELVDPSLWGRDIVDERFMLVAGF